MLHFQAEAATIDGPESSAAAMTSRAAEASLGEQAVHQKGFLAKRTTPLKVWKRRWFVLRAKCLAWYNNDKEYVLDGQISLGDVRMVSPVTKRGRPYVIGILTVHKIYYLQADSPMAMRAWIEGIRQACGPVALVNSPIRSRQPSDAQTTPNAPQPLPLPQPAAGPSGSQEASLPAFQASPTDLPARQLSIHEFADDDESSDEDELSVTVCDPSIHESRNGAEVLYRGYLLKRDKYKHWRKRWFVLRLHSLSYYKSQKENHPPRIIILDQIQEIREPHPESHKSKKPCFCLCTDTRGYWLCGDSRHDTDTWIDYLKMLTSSDTPS